MKKLSKKTIKKKKAGYKIKMNKDIWIAQLTFTHFKYI